MAIQFKVYNGREYVQITAEPEVDENGIFTGHYKEIKKEFISIDGILDDTQVLEGAIETINTFQKNNKSNYYLLTGYGNPALFSSYALVPDYNTLGDAVISYIVEKDEWLVESIENAEIQIIFKIFIRPINKSVTLKLFAQTAMTFSS